MATPRDDWLTRLQHDIATAALALGGFHHVSWNQRIRQLPKPGHDPRAVGMADWDGTLYYHLRHVLDPLRDLVEHDGAIRPRDVLRRGKEAVATMLHETYHMIAPDDHEQREGRAVYDQPSTVFLEEGVTELYTHHRLDDVIRMVGLDAAAPGICDVVLRPAYPQYVPGTERLLEWVGERSGVPYGELLESLAGETAAGKYPLLADALLVNTGLIALLPPSGVWAARRELEHAVRTAFDHIATMSHQSARVLTRVSLALAEDAIAALREVLEKIVVESGEDGPPPSESPDRLRRHEGLRRRRSATPRLPLGAADEHRGI